MPNLSYFPVSDNKDDLTAVDVSGVQVFPAAIKNKKKYSGAEIQNCEPFQCQVGDPITAASILCVFYNSVYPTAHEVLKFWADERREDRNVTFHNIGEKFKVPVHHLMTYILGPGIYYFALCRSCADKKDPKDLYTQYKHLLPPDHAPFVPAVVGLGHDSDDDWDSVSALLSPVGEFAETATAERERKQRQAIKRRQSIDQQARIGQYLKNMRKPPSAAAAMPPSHSSSQVVEISDEDDDDVFPAGPSGAGGPEVVDLMTSDDDGDVLFTEPKGKDRHPGGRRKRFR